MNLAREGLQGCILVRDSLDADGGFVLAHLLRLLLGIDSQHSVVVVALRHTASHYAQILRKISLNVGTLAAAGRFAVLDALRGPAQAPDQPQDLRMLLSALQAAAYASNSKGTPLCIIFDDLTVSV